MSNSHPPSNPEEAPLRKVTQRTVAEAANVSQSLVSLVLNGDGKEASEEIRQRIFEAAKSLNYTPLRRRGEKMKRKLFAMIRPAVRRGHHPEEWIYDSYEQFYLDLQEQFRLVLQRQGYNLIAHDDSDPKGVMEWLRKWGVEGVFSNSVELAFLDEVRKEFPVIEVTRSHHWGVDSVTSGDYERVAISFDYLYNQGHRRIGYLTSRQQAYRSIYHLAYQECCQAKQMSEEFIEIQRFVPDLERYAKRFAASKDRPTALIADPIRLLILQKHLTKLGVSIPQEVSLVSIDNISACRFMEPALVSIDLNFPELAEHALTTLLARIKDPSRARYKIEVLPHLVPGGSVAPPQDALIPSKLQATL